MPVWTVQNEDHRLKDAIVLYRPARVGKIKAIARMSGFYAASHEGLLASY